MSDVPLGAMLSGGLDSSLIVAAMAAEMSDPVETFAVGFKEDPRNELADARRIAAYSAAGTTTWSSRSWRRRSGWTSSSGIWTSP